MPYNGSGVFTPVANTVSPAVSATTISSADFNALMADLTAAGLTNAITKDGQTTITANIPFSTNKITGLGDATLLQDACTANQVVDNALIYCGASAVGTDAYSVTATISPGAYVTGSRFIFKADVANTGACSLNISGIGAISIKTLDGSDPIDNSIIADQFVVVIYDGTNFVLQNSSSIQTQITTNETQITARGMVLIESQTASASASLDFTSIDSTYTSYVIDIRNLVPATNGQGLYFRVSDDGGSTFKSGASDYRVSGSALAQIPIGVGASNVAADGGVCGKVNIYNPESASLKTLCSEVSITGGSATCLPTSTAGRYDTAATIDAVQLIFSSGNIASGVAKLYGIK
jgi:hypothetical protein